ncbi:hypothetical protein BDV26DRAFT_268733 [Aspergillus bertholletiae]|uniref:Uncharacterized protein n=1 Tax=Aspergillus bertholletiae TaxID=1226010 RepID=A0A5N7AZ44_9EURO|nr:hypothetical protein BDV26DRAFT_268733 [Aspergillus bertholletiae]
MLVLLIAGALEVYYGFCFLISTSVAHAACASAFTTGVVCTPGCTLRTPVSRHG